METTLQTPNVGLQQKSFLKNVKKSTKVEKTSHHQCPSSSSVAMLKGKLLLPLTLLLHHEAEGFHNQ